MAGPPRHSPPVSDTVATRVGTMKTFLTELFTWWNGQTMGTRFFTWRHGVRVGEDSAGNVYYRTADGKRRWVIYNGVAEASAIEPGWHGWMHHRTSTRRRRRKPTRRAPGRSRTGRT